MPLHFKVACRAATDTWNSLSVKQFFFPDAHRFRWVYLEAKSVIEIPLKMLFRSVDLLLFCKEVHVYLFFFKKIDSTYK